MTIDPSTSDVYPFLISLIAPRPIAWVTTLSPRGIVNLAPFSFFNVFGDDPPIVVFAPVLKADGSKKDTLRNLEQLPEFVLNIVTRLIAEKVNLTSTALPYEESEADLASLNLQKSTQVQPPRVIESPAHLECRVRQLLHIGTSTLVLGEVVLMHVDESFLNEKGLPDPGKLNLVGRMGGDTWTEASQLFELQRPTRSKSS